MGKAAKRGEITTYQEVFRTVIHLLFPCSPWVSAEDKCQGRKRKEIHDIRFDILHAFHMLTYSLELFQSGTKTLHFLNPQAKDSLVESEHEKFLFICSWIISNSSFYFII